MAEVTSLQLSLLGSPHILVNGRSLEVDRHKAIALLTYLAVTAERHQRQTLATLFWPNHDDKRAHANLRHVLWVLKKACGSTWWDIDRRSVRLRAGYRLDIDLFQEKIRSAQKLMSKQSSPSRAKETLALFTEADSLYRGAFLSGFSLRDAPEFDAWQRAQAQYLQQQLETVLQCLIEAYQHRKEWRAAILFGQRWLSVDPLHEPTQVQLMQLYLRAGKKAAALRQYEAYRELLALELGTAPQPETNALYQQILSGNLDKPVEPNPIQSVPQAFVHQLPLPLTPFFGRKEELEALRKRLENPFCRLLTIMGPGGIGKTRLALELAKQQSNLFAHGACFVPLAPVSSAEFIVQTIADALELTFTRGKDHQTQLLTYLRAKEILLVLDNFEHLLDGAELLLEILKEAPSVRLLVTSRERLNFQVEWLYTIQGLPLPTQTKNGAIAYSSVALFVYHATRVCPGFEFSDEEQTAVLRICRLLEGMPLGIELAAALRHTHTSETIAEQIQNNLDFLTTTVRDVPERHRGLRAIFEHSWNLLSDIEKQVLKPLSIFRGGFEFEAAVQVAQANSTILTTFINKSLLTQTVNGRYGMHERLRQFVSEKLSTEPAAQHETWTRYADYYALYLEQKESVLKGEGQQQAVDEILTEIENIRSTWRWNVQHRRKEAISRSQNSLGVFYGFTGRLQEGKDVFEWAIDSWQQSPEADVDFQITVACLQTRKASFDHRLANYEKAITLLNDSLVIFRHHKLPAEIAYALLQLGASLYYLGRYTEAVQAFEECLHITRNISDLLNQSAALNGLGNIYRALGQHDKARVHFQDSLNICRKTGNQRGLATALTNLGSLAEGQGDYHTAKQLIEESIIIKKAFNDRSGLAISHLNLGYIVFRLGEENYDEATQLLKKSLTEFQEMGEYTGAVFCLMNLGNIAYAQRSLADALEYYREGLRIASEINDRRGTAFLLNDLGNVLYDLQCYEEAEDYFRQALQYALDIQSLPHVMEALTGMTLFLVQREKIQESFLVLSFVLENPTTEEDCKERGKKVLAELRPQVSASERILAGEMAKEINLNEVLNIFTAAGLYLEAQDVS